MIAMHDLRDVGGTKGGLGHFIIGFALFCVGGYLLLDRVSVFGGYWTFFGSSQTSFGVTLIPLLLGIGMLFYNGKSFFGWLLTGGGFLILFAGVIANMQIHFQRTSLFNTLVMLVLIMAGVGMIVRSLRPVGSAAMQTTRQ
jgi:hypothetical protein